VILAAAIGAAVWLVWLLSMVTGPGLIDRAGNVKGGDFILFYVAGQVVEGHQTNHLYDPDVQEQIEHRLTGRWSGRHGLINPPFFALPFVPIAHLSYLAAFGLWSAFGIVLLLTSLSLVRRLDAAPWVFAFVPVWAAISYGQNSLLSLFLLTLVLALLERGHDARAGVALGGLLYKPQLSCVLALALLLERRWRALTGFGAMAILLAALSLAMSLTATLAYVATARSFATMMAEPGFPTGKMHSLYSFFVLLLPRHLTAAAVASLCCSIAVLVAMRRLQPPYSTDRLRVWYAIAIWATVLVSPHIPLYDLSLLVLPALLLRSANANAAIWRGAIAMIWATTILSQPVALAMHAAGYPSLQISVPVIALAGYTLLRECATNPVDPTSSDTDHVPPLTGNAGQRTNPR
jgi:hypothetical protein